MSEALLKRKSLIEDYEDDPLDDFYDVKISMPLTGELDFLYTSDIHAAWKDYGGSRFGDGSHKVFSLATDQVNNVSKVGGDVKAYQERLISNGIPTYLLDCGDWSLGSVSSTTGTTITTLQNMGYLGVTIGNWEFKHSSSSMDTNLTQINKMQNYGLMACNFRNKDQTVKYKGGKLGQNTTWTKDGKSQSGSVLQKLVSLNNIPLSDSVSTFNAAGIKAMKVGNKKIALIGVGYCSPNGYFNGRIPEGDDGDGTEWSAGTCRWNFKTSSSGTVSRHYDSVTSSSTQKNGTVSYNYGGCVYREVQYLLDFFNYYNFDYIIVFGHMDKFSDEGYSGQGADTQSVDGSEYPRVYTRADFMLRNTNGIDILIPGHYNFPIDTQYVVKWKNNTDSGIIAPEAGGEMNSFGRLKLDLVRDTVTCRLVKSVSDLTKINISDISAPATQTISY